MLSTVGTIPSTSDRSLGRSATDIHQPLYGSPAVRGPLTGVPQQPILFPPTPAGRDNSLFPERSRGDYLSPPFATPLPTVSSLPGSSDDREEKRGVQLGGEEVRYVPGRRDPNIAPSEDSLPTTQSALLPSKRNFTASGLPDRGNALIRSLGCRLHSGRSI